jgi:predicted nuclease of restriction endonuclease-like RecB superfamily
MYKSKFEEIVAETYKLHDKYEIEKIPYQLWNNYNPDFKMKENVYLEAKGFFKPSDRRKMLEVIKQHPEKRFIMFFQDSKVKLSKKSKTTYGDWCTKQNIQWFCWKYKRPTTRVLNLAIKNATNKSLEC